LGQNEAAMTMTRLGLLLAVVSAWPQARAQNAPPIAGLVAEIRPQSHQTPVGRPVWVRFCLENTTEKPITLTVPNTQPSIPDPEVGLPLSHVFSSGASQSIVVTTQTGRRWEQPSGFRMPAEAPILMLAARSQVAVTLDLREYYPAFRSTGQYKVTWQPYGGAVPSQTATITIAPLKQVEVVTDEGTMIIRLFYADAPKHVANFLELVESGFYTGKTFHRVEPGYLLQGGCPRGDGTGIRVDGKRLPSEINGHAMQKGSVAMALLDDDPDSASCQFFVCNTRQKEWDGRYTVFGELSGEESFATLDRLMTSLTDDEGRPLRPLYMRNVRVIEAPPDTAP
jgi:peptidyl-prolyl cis-trans isomerase B (cyclophilin B)